MFVLSVVYSITPRLISSTALRGGELRNKWLLSGMSTCPRSLATASVYIDCRLLGEKKTQDSIASKTSVIAGTSKKVQGNS
jgi:hypothetical protein